MCSGWSIRALSCERRSLLKPDVVLRSELVSERANRRNAHIGRMLAPPRAMRILKLKKFEVFRFEEEAVEHDDADLCLDKLPEESLIVFTEILRESAEAELRTGLSCECSQLRSPAGFRAAPDLDSPKIISTCS